MAQCVSEARKLTQQKTPRQCVYLRRFFHWRAIMRAEVRRETDPIALIAS